MQSNVLQDTRNQVAFGRTTKVKVAREFKKASRSRSKKSPIESNLLKDSTPKVLNSRNVGLN